jgi:hypothetical protein
MFQPLADLRTIITNNCSNKNSWFKKNQSAIRSWMGIIVETKEQTSDKHKHNIGQNETMPGFVRILTTLR